MPCFIQNSFIAKFIFKIIDCVLISYNNSKLKNIISRIGYIITQSAIFSFFKRYVNKNPAFLNSISYRFIRLIVNFINIIADKIHKPFALMISKSNTKEQVDNIKSLDLKSKLNILSLFIIAISIGFLIGSVLLNSIMSLNVAVGLGLLILALLIIFFTRNFNIIKNSLIYKFVEYLIH